MNVMLSELNSIYMNVSLKSVLQKKIILDLLYKLPFPLILYKAIHPTTQAITACSLIVVFIPAEW